MRTGQEIAKLFEAINEEDLKNKLEETMKEMNEMFQDASNNMFQGLSGEMFDVSGINMEDMPNPEAIKDHKWIIRWKIRKTSSLNIEELLVNKCRYG